jgi:hypothetical protein
MSKRKERIMSGTPTYGTSREAIVSIKEAWPTAASSPELLNLEEILSRAEPDDGTPLPESAREPVEGALRRLSEELGELVARPPGITIKPCELLERWAGLGPA